MNHSTMLLRFAPPLALLAATLPAQAATVDYYGRGCGFPSNPPPLIRSADLPRLGSSFTVQYIGPASKTPVSETQPVLMIGLQQISAPLPPIGPLQGALTGDCTLKQLPLVFLYMPLSGTRYGTDVKLSVPNDRALIGLTLYMQWGTIYRRCNGPCVDSALLATDGMRARLGT